MLKRWCWNWQTGMVEGHVPQGVGVQVPPSASFFYEENRPSAVFFIMRIMVSLFLDLHFLFQPTHCAGKQ
jgi:hypothetical protein